MSNGDNKPRGEREEPAQKCCVDTFEIVPDPIVNKVTRPSSGRRHAGAVFEMKAAFDDTAPCECSCCEYRQFIRGSFTYNGDPIDYETTGGTLDPVNWMEDCAVTAADPCYGHRANAGEANDRYLPNRADGCKYEGHDVPGLTGDAGTRFSVDLEFRGEIWDVCDGNRVVESKTWSVKISGRLSRRRRYWD